MAGRKPKPSNLLEFEGNPGGRPLNNREPKPKTAVPTCPDYLDNIAKAEWKRITPRLKALGLITHIDKTALVAYCDCYSEFIHMREAVREHGYICQSDKGNTFQNPEVGIKNTALSNMLKFLLEFGMTPSSRSRLKVELPKTESEVDPMQKVMKHVI